MMKDNFPLKISIIVFLAAIFILLMYSLNRTNWRLVYALDDPYIHLAMAKNFSKHLVWGITKYGFTSSSSSPLWTLILSVVFFIVGTKEIVPFIINLILAIVLLYAIDKILKRYISSRLILLIILVGTVFLTPLPALVFCGQEHILHIILLLSLIYYFSQFVSVSVENRKKIFSKDFLVILSLAFLSTAARYESLFVIASASSYLLLRRKFIQSVALAVAGSAPVVIYGIISVAKGWWFFPNSIVSKANVPLLSTIGMEKFLFDIYKNFSEFHITFMLLIALILLNILKKDGDRMSRILLLIFIASTSMHILFAKMGWFYRYEAYLVVVGIVSISIAAAKNPDRLAILKGGTHRKYKMLSTAVLTLLVAYFLVHRGTEALMYIPTATKNIFEQQYQMGLFLHKYYDGQCVVANDVGAINFLADIKCLDLLGLASMEVAEMYRDEKFSPENIAKLAREKDAKIAIVYAEWFDKYGGLPKNWQFAGQWKIFDNIVCGEDVVSFFAVGEDRKKLRKNLNDYIKDLPEDVNVLIML